MHGNSSLGISLKISTDKLNGQWVFYSVYLAFANSNSTQSFSIACAVCRDEICKPELTRFCCTFFIIVYFQCFIIERKIVINKLVYFFWVCEFAFELTNTSLPCITYKFQHILRWCYWNKLCHIIIQIWIFNTINTINSTINTLVLTW